MITDPIDLGDLYHEVVLDHGKRPRNFRVMEDADRSAEGYNPLCGDRVTVFLRVEDDRIADASFTGSGCAICTASASLMTKHLRGRSTDEATEAFVEFQSMLTGPEGDEPPAELGSLVALAGVRAYPMRVKCATLPWHTMRSALAGGDDQVTTE